MCHSINHAMVSNGVIRVIRARIAAVSPCALGKYCPARSTSSDSKILYECGQNNATIVCTIRRPLRWRVHAVGVTESDVQRSAECSINGTLFDETCFVK